MQNALEQEDTLEQLQQKLHRRKQEIIHAGLKKLPDDYIELKKEIDARVAQQTRASTNLFAEAKTSETSTSSPDKKAKI
jgi:hypothetical protein